jgi:DNA-binding transcriptional LysR family regulator
MDTQQLLTFQKLAKEQSFKRASKELGISQPTVTMRIKALEEEVGEILFLRTGQKAILTPTGELFLQYVDRALRIFESGMDIVKAGQGSNTLTIAGTAAMNTYVLPAKLQQFQRHMPELQWRIYTGTSDDILQMIVDEIADIGLIRGSLRHSNVYSYPLYPEELCLVMPPEHPLAAQPSLDFTDLKQEPILIYRRSSETWRLIAERFLQAGVKPNVAMELEHVVAVKQMVLHGAGIAFLPEITVAENVKGGSLVRANLSGPPIIRYTSIVIPQKKPTPAAAQFLRFLHAQFAPDSIPEGVGALLET